MRMQRILLVTVLAIAFAGVAFAGDYHNGATLTCSECHVMHASQTHGYNADGGGFFGAPNGENEGLLRDEVNALCLGCHDGQTAYPDVMGNQTGAVIRAAGALNDGTDTAPYYNADGHTLGSTELVPGGNGANFPDGLKCVDCHNQHGYGGGTNPWRNLYANGQVISYETAATPTGDFDVTQAASLNYSYDNLTFNKTTLNPTLSAYADYCKGCHTNFHGAVGGSEIGGSASGGFIRHPATDVIIGGIGGGHSSSAVFGSHTNNVLVQTDGTNLTPSCFSCHKGHGNQNAFGLIFMEGTGTVTEEGDNGTAAKALCGQCHVQG